MIATTFNSRRLLSCLCLLLSLSTAQASIFLDNQTLPSLPALFGRYMVEGKKYRARLQYLPENPFLCEPFDPQNTSFVLPPNMPVVNNMTFPPEPIVLLARRDNCPFAKKAAVAESIHPRVQFLIIYNHDKEGKTAALQYSSS